MLNRKAFQKRLIGGDNNMTNNKLSKLETENYKKGGLS